MQRNSNFELLRVYSMFAILYMHSFGTVLNQVVGFNEIFGIIESSLFNTGVGCLMLISGYFGIEFRIKKIVSMECMLLFFSFSKLFINISLGTEMSRMNLVSYFFPIISRNNWFVSCYVFIVFLSPFINKIPMELSKRSFEKLLLLLLFLFSVIPTFLFFDITGDGGKGIVHLFIIYLLGRYIRLYFTKVIEKKLLLVCFIGSVFLTFGSNMLGRSIGLMHIFSRDCSITIVISSVILFLLFKELKIKSIIINKIAQYTLPILVGESVFYFILGRFVFINRFDVENYKYSNYLGLIVLCNVIFVIIVGVFVNIIRNFLFNKLEKSCGNIFYDLSKKIKNISLVRYIFK